MLTSWTALLLASQTPGGCPSFQPATPEQIELAQQAGPGAPLRTGRVWTVLGPSDIGNPEVTVVIRQSSGRWTSYSMETSKA